jgi:hypothetical protein
MEKIFLAGLALGVLTTAYVPPASAAGVPEGRKCAFDSATDVTTEPGVQTGRLSGGPLVSLDGSAGTIVCTIQVNDNTHAGADAAGGAGITATASVLAPMPISYHATALDTVVLCTSYVDNNGVSLYWTDGALPGEGSWSTDPNASCTRSKCVVHQDTSVCTYVP